MADPQPIAVTYATAAEMLEVSKITLERLVRSGEIPVVRIGRLVRIPVVALQEWVVNNAVIVNNNRVHAGHCRQEEDKQCHEKQTETDSTGAAIHRTGGALTPMSAAEELGARLAKGTKGKRPKSWPNGNSKPKPPGNGNDNKTGRSTI